MCAAEGGPHRPDVFGMHPAEPFIRLGGGRVRGHAQHRFPARGEVDLVANEIPVPHPVVRASRRERVAGLALFEGFLRLGAVGDVMQEDGGPRHEREHTHLQDPVAAGALEREAIERFRLLGIEHGLDEPRQRCGCERRHRVAELPADDLLPRQTGEPLDRVVPERDPSIARDHDHAFIQRLDDFAMAVLVVQSSGVDAVGSIRQIHRNTGQREQIPHPPADHFCNQDGHGRADKIARRAPQEVLLPHPPDRLVGGERDRDGDRPCVHEEIGDHGRHQRRRTARPDRGVRSCPERRQRRSRPPGP